MSIQLPSLVCRASAFLLLLLLAACGGGGVVTSDGVALRTLPSEYSSRQGVAYSPFRTGNRDMETVTAAHIKQDLDLLQVRAKYPQICPICSGSNGTAAPGRGG